VSYDLFFAPNRYDRTFERRLNPFTKEMGDVERNHPLSDAEVAAVLQVIERADPEWPMGTRDFCSLRFERSTVEMSLDGVGDGCSLAIRGLGFSLDFAEFLFEVLVVGNWILFDDSAAAVANEAVLQGNPRDGFVDVVVVRSPAELMATFAPGFDAWKGYRDRVIG
jgi:hypothetical protein